MLNKLMHRSLSFYMRLALAVISVVPVVYLFIMNMTEYYISAVFLLLAAAVVVLSLVFDEKPFTYYMIMASALLLCVGLGAFLTGCVLSVIDYIYNIVMWGDPSQFGMIVFEFVFMMLAVTVNVVLCFIHSDKKL